MELLTEHELATTDIAQLSHLYDVCFGGMEFAKAPQPTRRVILRKNMIIVAHAAASIRQVKLDSAKSEVAILGAVCVLPAYRGKHFGHQVVQGLHEALSMPFILNCGVPLIPYYQSIGYKLISPTASYLRQGIIVVDEDPVMLFTNGYTISTEIRTEPVYFGEDF